MQTNAQICPTCSQPLGDDYYESLEFLYAFSLALSRSERTVLRALILAYPRPLSTRLLLAAIYPDQGKTPKWARTCTKVFVHRVRSAIAPRGWTIKGRSPGRGQHESEYRLLKLGDA